MRRRIDHFVAPEEMKPRVHAPPVHKIPRARDLLLTKVDEAKRDTRTHGRLASGQEAIDAVDWRLTRFRHFSAAQRGSQSPSVGFSENVSDLPRGSLYLLAVVPHPHDALLGDPAKDSGHPEQQHVKASLFVRFDLRIRRIGIHFDFHISIIHGFSSFHAKLQSTAIGFASRTFQGNFHHGQLLPRITALRLSDQDVVD